MSGKACENIIRSSTRTLLTAVKVINTEECVTSTKAVSQVDLAAEDLCFNYGSVTARVEFIVCAVSHPVIPTGRLVVAKIYPKQGNKRHWAAAFTKIYDG